MSCQLGCPGRSNASPLRAVALATSAPGQVDALTEQARLSRVVRYVRPLPPQATHVPSCACRRAAAVEPALPFSRNAATIHRKASLRLRRASQRPARVRRGDGSEQKGLTNKDTSGTARGVHRLAHHACTPGQWVKYNRQADGKRLKSRRSCKVRDTVSFCHVTPLVFPHSV